MRETRLLMGMPITIEVVDATATQKDIDNVFAYFKYIDEKFSTYKDTSEISRINRGELKESEYSEDMKTVFVLAEETKQRTDGYFDIKKPDGTYDPSGLVKGWAIYHAALLLEKMRFQNFYVDAGGDIQVKGKNTDGKLWSVGIKNPLNQNEIVKVAYLNNKGIATSGSYIRGDHIYNPHEKNKELKEIVSFTVIGPNVYEADRFATAAFAMGTHGIAFIETLEGCDGYMIDSKGIATMTSEFEAYAHERA